MIARALIAALLGAALALPAQAQSVSAIQKSVSPFTPPNVTATCGADGTTAIQAALNAASTNNGIVQLPACPKTSPITISAVLTIPSNTTLLGASAGTTWLKEGNAANLQPIITNTNYQGAASTLLDSNIEVGFLSVDGNGSQQTAATATRCIYFVGVANVNVHDIEVDNCTADAVKIDGNGAAAVEPAFANRIFVNTTIGVSGTVSAGVGFTVGNRQRNASVSNIVTFNTAAHGILIDASESNWSSLTAKASGTGNACTSATTHLADNPGGGAANYNWDPCPANIYVRNVTNVSATNMLATQGRYHGVLVVGARHTSLSNITSTNNSQQSSGTWDDLHLDLNVFNSYGESHALTIAGVSLGSNSQAVTSPNQTLSSSPPVSRYGLSIADGIAGSVGDVAVAAGGTAYAFNNTLTLSGGTSSIAGVLTVATAPGGIIGTVNHNYATGAGVYTVLPANPVAVTGGAGSGATFNVTWSTGSITDMTIGPTVTASTRIPAFFTNWYVQSNAGNFGPRGLPVLSACGTSPSLSASATDNLGKITVGATTATCTLTFAQPFATRVNCVVQSGTTLAAFGYTYTTSAITITATTLGGDLVDYSCQGL